MLQPRAQNNACLREHNTHTYIRTVICTGYTACVFTTVTPTATLQAAVHHHLLLLLRPQCH